MSETTKHAQVTNGRRIEAWVTEAQGYATEAVIERKPDGDFTVLHEQGFQASMLGTACREEYLRVMTSSILDREARAARAA